MSGAALRGFITVTKLFIAEAALASALLCICPAIAAAAPKPAHAGHDHAAGEDLKHDRATTANRNDPKAREPAKDEHAGHGHADKDHDEDGGLALSGKQVEASKIEIGVASSGVLAQKLSAPGVITVNQDRVARIPAKVVGAVAELRKRLGEKDEIVAVLDSREVADAKSEFLSALVAFDLQKTLFERTQILWTKRITTEQTFLQSRATFAAAELRLALARQKLVSLGLDGQSIGTLRSGVSSDLRQYPIRSPIAGRIIERKVDVGAAVGSNNDPSELYTVADLSSLWIDLSVPTAELEKVREGQGVTIFAPGGREARGRIVFIGPVLNQDTRSARVLASFPNPEFLWRPGGYVSAMIDLTVGPVAVRIPRGAIQMIEGKPSVFVRTEKGFDRRPVTLGNGDGDTIEILNGLTEGERIATTNTFLLKAELGKAEASHDH
jgi:cobalt-zinc-cadmium efflux system membrane fusion protein